ncbi:MAG: chorismate mutase [Acidobacteriota bacterium]
MDAQLKEFRARIDVLDERLIRLLAERFEITKSVGEHKAEVGLPAADKAREAEQIARLQGLAREVGMDPIFFEKVFRLIVDEVIRHHERLAEREDAEGSAG